MNEEMSEEMILWRSQGGEWWSQGRVKEGMKERVDECIKKASEMVVALNLAYVFEYTSDIDLEEDL